MRIRAQLQLMAASEIATMIEPGMLAEIKRQDPAPLFKAFVVGHEGESRGNLVGIGNVVKRWLKTMVQKLHDKIQAGLQLFSGHAATNDHAGRAAIGQVAGKRLMNIDGKESVVVACYIDKAYRHLPLDVASVEIDVHLEEAPDGALDIVDVGDVTAIALGNAAVDTPGFPGATLVGQLQAFEKQRETASRLRLGYSTGQGRPRPMRLV